MNRKNNLLCAVTSLMVASLVVACNTNKPSSSVEPKPLEIGDTVKEWRSSNDLDTLPLGVADKNSKGEIVKDFGNYDKSSLKFEVKDAANMYLGSDLVDTPYFTEDDAKNGDIISLYVYAPSDGNISSFQLEVFPISMNNSIKSDLLTITSDIEDTWRELTVSFDTLETLGAIRLNYRIADPLNPASFYVDNINITLGEETVKTAYEFNDESLYKAYEPYFKVGGCLSTRMFRNTEIRKMVKDNFNSITAENEGKPEQILDQDACKELAKLMKHKWLLKPLLLKRFMIGALKTISVLDTTHLCGLTKPHNGSSKKAMTLMGRLFLNQLCSRVWKTSLRPH